MYRLVLPNRTEEVQLPLVRLCKTLFCQGLLAGIWDMHTLASISKLQATCRHSVTKTQHKNPQTHTHTHTQCTYRISGISTRLVQQTTHALTLTYFSPAFSLPFGLPVLHDPSLIGQAVLSYWLYFGDFSPFFGEFWAIIAQNSPLGSKPLA
jgi:hypothetical protein